MAPFSVIVFGVVVWTIAVSGAKQLRFRLKTGGVDGALSADICKNVFGTSVIRANVSFTGFEFFCLSSPWKN